MPVRECTNEEYEAVQATLFEVGRLLRPLPLEAFLARVGHERAFVEFSVEESARDRIAVKKLAALARFANAAFILQRSTPTEERSDRSKETLEISPL